MVWHRVKQQNDKKVECLNSTQSIIIFSLALILRFLGKRDFGNLELGSEIKIFDQGIFSYKN